MERKEKVVLPRLRVLTMLLKMPLASLAFRMLACCSSCNSSWLPLSVQKLSVVVAVSSTCKSLSGLWLEMLRVVVATVVVVVVVTAGCSCFSSRLLLLGEFAREFTLSPPTKSTHTHTREREKRIKTCNKIVYKRCLRASKTALSAVAKNSHFGRQRRESLSRSSTGCSVLVILYYLAASLHRS